MDLAERISTQIDTLSPKLQIAGRFVLEHPEEVATRSLRHVARQVGMSAPTFSRHARCKAKQRLRMPEARSSSSRPRRRL